MAQLRATRQASVGHPGRARLSSVFAGAAGAYALRLPAGSTYSGPLVRVRRSDNLEQDIGAVTTATANGDRLLDTAALLAFAGAGSAFVTTWYDQSGAGFHAVQTTPANQPAIVEAGVLFSVNGDPSLRFSGNQWLRAPVPMNGTAGTLSVVRRIDSAAAAWCGLLSLGHGGAGTDNSAFGKMVHGRNSVGTGLDTRAQNVFFQSASAAYGVLYIDTVRFGGGAASCRVNGALAGQNPSMPVTLASTFTLIGARDNGSNAVGGFLSGAVSEAVLFSSALSDGAAQALERSQGAYFGISLA